MSSRQEQEITEHRAQAIADRLTVGRQGGIFRGSSSFITPDGGNVIELADGSQWLVSVTPWSSEQVEEDL